MGRPRKIQPTTIESEISHPALNLQRLTQTQLAGALGVVDRSIRNWIKDADPAYPFPRIEGANDRETRYSLAQVVKWLCDDAARAALSRVDASPENQAAATLRKTIADAELKELELARRKDELLEVQDVERTWTGALSRFRSTLLGSRSALAEDILRLETLAYPEIGAVYDRYIYQALSDLSELKPDDQPETIEDVDL